MHRLLLVWMVGLCACASANLSSLKPESRALSTEIALNRRVEVTLTHLNIEETQDGGLTGPRDELIVWVFTWHDEVPGPRPVFLGQHNLGSWGKTGQAFPVNRILFNNQLPAEADGVEIWVIDEDDTSASDLIGIVRWDIRGGGQGNWVPVKHARAFGQTIPGSWDFQMYADDNSARQSYWFRGRIQ